MKHALIALAFCAGCTSTQLQAASPAAPPDHPLEWITGCWISESGAAKEVWSDAEAGYLFGYAVTLKEGGVSFFEQMRIQPGPLYVLNVYPKGIGPSKFVESLQGDQSITFINAAHDYPQLIHYQRLGDELHAHIALEDGTNRRDFAYQSCVD